MLKVLGILLCNPNGVKTVIITIINLNGVISQVTGDPEQPFKKNSIIHSIIKHHKVKEDKIKIPQHIMNNLE